MHIILHILYEACVPFNLYFLVKIYAKVKKLKNKNMPGSIYISGLAYVILCGDDVLIKSACNIEAM